MRMSDLNKKRLFTLINEPTKIEPGFYMHRREVVEVIGESKGHIYIKEVHDGVIVVTNTAAPKSMFRKISPKTVNKMKATEL